MGLAREVNHNKDLQRHTSHVVLPSNDSLNAKRDVLDANSVEVFLLPVICKRAVKKVSRLLNLEFSRVSINIIMFILFVKMMSSYCIILNLFIIFKYISGGHILLGKH